MLCGIGAITDKYIIHDLTAISESILDKSIPNDDILFMALVGIYFGVFTQVSQKLEEFVCITVQILPIIQRLDLQVLDCV